MTKYNFNDNIFTGNTALSTGESEMVKKVVYTKPDHSVDIFTVEDKDFAIDEGTVSKKHYAAQLQCFEAMQKRLREVTDSSRPDDNHPAAKFLRVHGVWLANLSRTGFAIDYAQFVRD